MARMGMEARRARLEETVAVADAEARGRAVGIRLQWILIEMAADGLSCLNGDWYKNRATYIEDETAQAARDAEEGNASLPPIATWRAFAELAAALRGYALALDELHAAEREVLK